MGTLMLSVSRIVGVRCADMWESSLSTRMYIPVSEICFFLFTPLSVIERTRGSARTKGDKLTGWISLSWKNDTLKISVAYC